MPPFKQDFARSWMSTERLVEELDKLVIGRLASTLRLHGRPTRPPIEFRLLIRRLADHVERGHPFDIVCTCALLGELVFTSGRGGIYQLTESSDADERKVHEPLLALRNACFHPGNLGATPSIPTLVEALRKTSEPGVAERLGRDWGLLSLSNDLARWALQQAHAIGRFELMAIQRWFAPRPPTQV